MEHNTTLDWKTHIESGYKYLKTAGNGRARPDVFTPELIYQITAMAVEQLLVGLYQYHNIMPYDHTLDGLVDGLEQIYPLKKDLGDAIKAMGHFDDMCPLVPVKKCIPTDMQIQDMLTAARQVAEFAGQHIKMPVDL